LHKVTKGGCVNGSCFCPGPWSGRRLHRCALPALMQRITSLTARRELRGLAACTSGVRARKSGSNLCTQPVGHRQWSSVNVRPARPLTSEPGRRLCRRRFVFAGEKHRLFSSQPGAEEPPGASDRQPPVSVIGIPDPLTWIRCKVITSLTDLYFETDINSAEFDRGVKQVTDRRPTRTTSQGQQHVPCG